jgi:Na+/melibiose symporter-like transporter
MTSVVTTSGGEERAARTGQTFLYFGSLTLFVYLASPSAYLLDFQTSYMLKNQLHATAQQTSAFRLVTALPVYLAFAFGFFRDAWNPFGLRDRGYLLIFSTATALLFTVMAFSKLSYGRLYVGMFLAMLFFRFVMAAYQGLMALVGQEKLMSGRLSVVWQVVQTAPLVAGGLASGYISMYFEPNFTFILAACFAGFIGLLGFWKPRSVFSHAYDQPQAKGTSLAGDVKRLVKHWAIYPAILIMFLWSFAPGTNTPLQYYLTDRLHMSDDVYSYYNAIFAAAFVPTFLLYGVLCKKVALKWLLWCGTIVAIPQLIPLAFIHSANLVLWLAVPIGLLGGVATAAYYDLAMRSCPPGLQGTLMMAVDGVYVLAVRGGDVLGTKIYDSSPEHGFLYCVITTTAVYVLILPLILLVPKQLIATADGEPNPAVEAEMLKEIEATS